jgi:hypothetical protein
MVARYTKKMVNEPYLKNDMIGGAGKALAKSPYSFKQKMKKITTATAKAPISLSFATAKAATTGVGLGVSRLFQKPALGIKKMISKRKVTKAQNELNKQFGITKDVKKLGKKIDKIKRLEAAQQLLISTGKKPGKVNALQKQIEKLQTKTTRPQQTETTSKIGRRFTAYNALLKTLETNTGTQGTKTGTNTPLGLEALRTKLLQETTKKTAKQRFAEERLKRKIRGYETTKSRYRSVGFMNILTQSKKDFSL